MIELHRVHFATIKSMKNFGLDYTKFETVDELKAELVRLRKERNKEMWSEKLRVDMRRNYQEDPEKYKQMRYKNRNKEKERDPEGFKLKCRTYCKNSYLRKKIKRLENFQVLELSPIQEENEYEIVN